MLVICNHCSNADGMLLMAYVVPAMGRPMGWLGKEEALRWPVFGWAMRQNGVFGVRRGAGDLEAFKLAKRVLDEGRVLDDLPRGHALADGRAPGGQGRRHGPGRPQRRADPADRDRRLAALLAEGQAPAAPAAAG